MRATPLFLLLPLLFLVALATPTRARADTVDAASCNPDDVETALGLAASGDTVAIPAGTCHWTRGIDWSAPSDVTLIGASDLSVRGGDDATVIVDDAADGAPLLFVRTSGAFRLAGVTFRGGAGAIKETAVVAIGGASDAVRVDHVHFDMPAYTTGEAQNSKMIRFLGDLSGVVYESAFDMIDIGNYLFFQGADDDAWAEPTDFGGPRFVFVEDNDFRGRDTGLGRFVTSVTDCNAGGRFVIRFNALESTAVGQTHPTGGAGRGRGCRAHELYRNTVTAAPSYDASTDEPSFTFAYMTSGTLMIWGNDFGDSLFKNFLYLNSLRKDNTTYSESPTPDGWGYCGTELTGTGSAWDGNTDAVTGYPCLDDVGRGQGDLISGDFPSAMNTRTGTIAWPQQALEPVYAWANTGSVHSGWGGARLSNHADTRLRENRDFYLEAASFTGATGVGMGPRASRPTTCTPGVAYWSTDQGGDWDAANATTQDGTLDVCTATDTWRDAQYTPYPHPHPLVSGVAPPVRDGGVGVDVDGGGTTPGRDGGGAGSDGGETIGPVSEDGCGCRVSGTRSHCRRGRLPALGWAALAVLVGWRARRRVQRRD